MKSLYQALAELERNNESAALCTVVRSQGSTPRHSTSKMLVYDDGSFIGTVGGGELENRVFKEAKEALNDGKSRLLEYSMADPARGDPGVCGGTVEVFVEPILPAPTLVVIGGGHVGKAVAHLAKWLNFRVAVSDDRPEFVTPEANPDADDFYECKIEDLPEKLKINRHTYLVLTTRGVAVDAPGLEDDRGQTQRDGHLREADCQSPFTDWAGIASRNPGRDRGQHHGRNPDVARRRNW